MILLAALVYLAYGFVILEFSRGINLLGSTGSGTALPEHRFSLVVPFRNEEENLPVLLESLKELDYPLDLFEAVFVNDRSTDASASIVKKFKEQHPEIRLSMIEIKQESPAPKKRAIQEAILIARHSWIVTTDADCSFGPHWLREIDRMISLKGSELIVGPVTYGYANTFLERFQALDFMSLQGATMGSFAFTRKKGLIKPFMCNGANLAYSKQSFKAVKGFEGNENIASGDDVFLLEKMLSRFPEKVHYLKSEKAVVFTSPLSSWRKLMHQRVRWASKTSSYSNRFGKFLGVLVFTVNFLLLLLTVLALLGHIQWTIPGLFFLLKFNLDFLLIYRTANFFGQSHFLRSYFLASLAYPIFSVLVVIRSVRGTYYWKGRTY